LNLSGCCHSWFNSPKYYITCIVHNKACNINCHSKEDMIICGVFIKRRLHSLCHCPCHRDLYLKLVEFLLLLFRAIVHYNLTHWIEKNSTTRQHCLLHQTLLWWGSYSQWQKQVLKMHSKNIGNFHPRHKPGSKNPTGGSLLGPQKLGLHYLPGSQKYVCFNMGSNLPKKSPRMGKLCPRYFGLGPKCKACRNYSLGLNYF